MEQGAEDHPKGQQGDPDGSSPCQMAEKGSDDCAEYEKDQHPEMLEKPDPVGFVRSMPVLQLPGDADSDLADMVCGKGGGHRNALRLPEGIVLHGSDEVDGHLGYLNGSGITADISMAIRRVSHRMGSLCFTGFGSSSETTAPMR